MDDYIYACIVSKIHTNGSKLGAYSGKNIVLVRLAVFFLRLLNRKGVALLKGCTLACLRWRRSATSRFVALCIRYVPG